MLMTSKVCQKETPLAPSSFKDGDDRKRGSCLFSVGQSPHLEFSWITPPWFGLYLTSLRSGCRGIQTAGKFLMGNLLLISPGCVPRLPEQTISVVVTLSEVTGSVLTLVSYTWLQWAPGATFSSGRKFTEKWVNVCEVGFTSFTHWE